jgi:hypothetical protein
VPKHIETTGIVTIDVPAETGNAHVNSFSIGSASGPLRSVIHGTRVEIGFPVSGAAGLKISMAAADALQLAEEIRAIVHGREDVKRR